MTEAALEYHWGTGRRKTSVARVRLRRGTGMITVNGKEMNVYFPIARAQEAVEAPLRATKVLNKYDVIIKAHGGGILSQSGAVTLGIARALVKADNTLEAKLRQSGFLTRDPRMVERKKYGRRGARAGIQFSKR